MGKSSIAWVLLNSEDLRQQDSVVFQIIRNQEEKRIVVHPTQEATLGFIVKAQYDLSTTHVDLDLTNSIKEGFSYGYWTLYDYVAQFKYIFTKKEPLKLEDLEPLEIYSPVNGIGRAFGVVLRLFPSF